MEFQRKVPIERIVEPSHAAILFLNFTEDNFEKCFSKMELTMGMDYLSWAIRKFEIPTIFANLAEDPDIPEDLAEYRDSKIFNRSAHSAPKSSLDAKFMNEFQKYLPDKNSTSIEVKREDAFFSSGLAEKIRKMGKTTVMIAGFYTEVDVFITAAEALMHDFYSVVISDATSTFSERVFFQSLDMISQVVEVIDTRDLEKIWGVE
ncbi:MAG TPA: isochorismatase family cysteine hydrolase [Thermoplasmataceae archaeon]|nr:isochorismatase family cysteine hydrolase [Thermoplasmataceae archaeon]